MVKNHQPLFCWWLNEVLSFSICVFFDKIKVYLAVPEWWNTAGTQWSRSSAGRRNSTGPSRRRWPSPRSRSGPRSPTGPSLSLRSSPPTLTDSGGSPSPDRESLPWFFCWWMENVKLQILKPKVCPQHCGCELEYDIGRCEVKKDFTNDPACLHTAQSCTEGVGWSVLVKYDYCWLLNLVGIE